MSMSLDRAGRDAQSVGDLGLAEVKVVAQGQHLALSPGQVAQGGNQPIPGGCSRARVSALGSVVVPKAVRALVSAFR